MSHIELTVWMGRIILLTPKKRDFSDWTWCAICRKGIFWVKVRQNLNFTFDTPLPQQQTWPYMYICTLWYRIVRGNGRTYVEREGFIYERTSLVTKSYWGKIKQYSVKVLTIITILFIIICTYIYHTLCTYIFCPINLPYQVWRSRI